MEVDTASRALVVQTDNGVAVRLPEQYLGDVHHGYALTGHISQGTTVERPYLLATPERGGREWAYVAASRQRLDLSLFAVHHDRERLEAALARSWERSDAKQLALELADTDHCATATAASRSELDRLLPERVGARLTCLHEARESARRVALTGSGEEAAWARQEAQLLTHEIRACQAVAAQRPAPFGQGARRGRRLPAHA